MTHSGGELAVKDDFRLGVDTGGHGTYTLTGNTKLNVTDDMDVGYGSSGTATLSNGQVTVGRKLNTAFLGTISRLGKK